MGRFRPVHRQLASVANSCQFCKNFALSVANNMQTKILDIIAKRSLPLRRQNLFINL